MMDGEAKAFLSTILSAHQVFLKSVDIACITRVSEGVWAFAIAVGSKSQSLLIFDLTIDFALELSPCSWLITLLSITFCLSVLQTSHSAQKNKISAFSRVRTYSYRSSWDHWHTSAVESKVITTSTMPCAGKMLDAWQETFAIAANENDFKNGAFKSTIKASTHPLEAVNIFLGSKLFSQDETRTLEKAHRSIVALPDRNSNLSPTATRCGMSCIAEVIAMFENDRRNQGQRLPHMPMPSLEQDNGLVSKNTPGGKPGHVSSAPKEWNQQNAEKSMENSNNTGRKDIGKSKARRTISTNTNNSDSGAAFKENQRFLENATAQYRQTSLMMNSTWEESSTPLWNGSRLADAVNSQGEHMHPYLTEQVFFHEGQN